MIVLYISQVSSTDGSHPGVKEEFYEAIRQVLLCLDSLTDLLLTCGGMGEDEPQLRLLQHEVTENNVSHCHFIRYTFLVS